MLSTLLFNIGLYGCLIQCIDYLPALLVKVLLFISFFRKKGKKSKLFPCAPKNTTPRPVATLS